MDPENFIGYLIKSSARGFTNQVNQQIKLLGLPLTVEQVGIIFKLTLSPGVTQKDLADFFVKDKTTIARVVTVMEKNALVQRVPCESDKRVNRLYITKKGKELHGVLANVALAAGEKATKDISEQELSICKTVLLKIKQNLEE